MSSERQAFNDGFDKGYSKALDKIASLEALNAELAWALDKSYIHLLDKRIRDETLALRKIVKQILAEAQPTEGVNDASNTGK